MATIRELTSPNGWPASEDRKALGIESFTVPGTKIKFACAKTVAPLLVNFAKEFNESVEPIDVGQLDDWGYAFRMTRGSDKVLSNPLSAHHSFVLSQLIFLRVKRRPKFFWHDRLLSC